MNEVTTLLVMCTHNVGCQGMLFAKILEGRTSKDIFNKL